MTNQLINIRTDKFSKKEIKVIEEALKEWNYEWIVDIVYFVKTKMKILMFRLHLNKRT